MSSLQTPKTTHGGIMMLSLLVAICAAIATAVDGSGDVRTPQASPGRPVAMSQHLDSVDASVVAVASEPPRQGGENISTATQIPDLGQEGTFIDSGTTIGFIDDYSEACPTISSSADSDSLLSSCRGVSVSVVLVSPDRTSIVSIGDPAPSECP